ncbi:hypothetical protein [Streptomyces leeuwenhoekii]|uniref:Uncharacterized protein n=1 Tax=Streptomyces leeuwenhoekii TaxID=1437453 RepID=A0A0F7VL94_STRLW|nr:hypothetical protein [Streptomyces leeuwenhoekii]KMS78040.1 hypothetical protein ACH49_18180 [Streptomyces leeuwenhoekii]CQR59400.1 hypothetical protein [Streptomyces leeuwenhoekii]
MAHTIPLKTPLDDTGLLRRKTPASPVVTVPADASRYHHPRFVDAQPAPGGGTAFRFMAFTGREPQPEFPAAAYDDPAMTWELRDQLHDQYTAARVLWSQSRLRRQATPLLHHAASLWSAWLKARDELVDSFQQFWSTADGLWRAQMLRLTDAERAAAQAADAFDAVARQLAQAAADQVDVAGWDEALPLTTVAREIGYDASDWKVHHVDDYTAPYPQYRIVRNGVDHYGRATPLAASATQLIEEQRERLREVATLAGDTDPALRTLV